MNLLFYNGNSGLSELYNLDDQGGITQLSIISFVQTTWTHIVPRYIGYSTTLLFYDNRSGIAEFYGLDQYGNFNQLSSTTYSPGWTHIVPGTFGLLFYNSRSGLGQFYRPDGSGGIQQLSSSTYSTGWTHIVVIPPVVGPDFNDDDLLFYN